MRKLTLVLGLMANMLAASAVYGQSAASSVKTGDIILQKLPCGGLCDAIIATTPCKTGLEFNHCGIVTKEKTGIFVIEAIGNKVKKTSLAEFLTRDSSTMVHVARPLETKLDMNALIAKANKYIGTPYDHAFLPGDSAIYCSELVWECYRVKGEPIFQLAPMTFNKPGTQTIFPQWAAYFKELNAEVPEGLLGLNPCAITNSDKVLVMPMSKN